MAVISAVEANSVASSTHQNGLITQVNTNTTNISTNTSSIATLESRTTNASTGNTALGSRVTALEGGGTTGRAARYKTSSSSQSFTSGVESTVTGWTTTISSADISQSNGNFTVNRTGLWLVMANINLQSGGGTANAERIIKIYHNGAVEAFSAVRSPAGGDHTFLNTSALLNVTTTGTAVNVTAQQGTGAGMAVRLDSSIQFIWIRGS